MSDIEGNDFDSSFERLLLESDEDSDFFSLLPIFLQHYYDLVIECKKYSKTMLVKYKFAETNLGCSLIAEAYSNNTSQVCFSSFPKAKSDAEYLNELLKLYPRAIPADELDCEKDVVNALNGTFVSNSIKVLLDGPEFSVLVWKEIMKIPYGQVASYSDIAKAMGKPTAYRAVAQACSRNHIAVIVPCHRIIASNGNISGFGWGVDNKKMLLDREGYLFL